jgi:hypothetical protein
MEKLNEQMFTGKLVNGEKMLDEVFDPDARPSIRWLRTQTKAKTIPHFRIGHLIFFNVEMVRAALAGKNLVRHRISASGIKHTASIDKVSTLANQ